MKLIGLTGNFCTGKSTVAWILQEFNVPLIDTDEIAHDVIAPESAAWRQLFDRYGKTVLLKDKAINRAKLAEIVFRSAVEKKFVEGVIHPHIKEEVERRLAHLRRNRVPFCVIEAPLLYEAHWEQMMDLVVVVSCPREAEIERAQKKHGLSREEVELRLRNQLPLEKKLARADIIIDNAGALEETRVQVERLYRAWEKGDFSAHRLSRG